MIVGPGVAGRQAIAATPSLIANPHLSAAKDDATGLSEIRFALVAEPVDEGPLAPAFASGESQVVMVDPIGIRLVFERV